MVRQGRIQKLLLGGGGGGEGPNFTRYVDTFLQLVTSTPRQVSVIGCGHTIELNRDLASKSRLTSNHDLAENRDLIYFWSNYTEFNRDLSLLKFVNHAKNTDGRHRSLSLYCMPVTELVVVFTNLTKTYFCSSKFYIVLSFIPLLDI